jgi:hypothetical protein
MARVILAVFGALAMFGCSYGEPVDESGIEAAVMVNDGQTIVLAYHELKYRPAIGLAAFPDGGVAKYVSDREILAATTVHGNAPRILRRLENKGVHGSASISLRVSDADPDHVLVTSSGQPSTDRPSSARRWRLDWRGGAALPYPDITANLKDHGSSLGSRAFGDVQIVAADGTLLIGATSQGVDQLWLLPPNGDYVLLDHFKQFYGVRGDEIYYWKDNEAIVRNWRSGAARVVARYDVAHRQTTRLLQDSTVSAIEQAARPEHVAVSPSSDKQSIVVQTPDGARTAVSFKREAFEK